MNANSKWARTLFGGGNGVDYGSGVPKGPATPPPELPGFDQPIFSTHLVSPNVAANLPNGYQIRPLCCEDYDRGYMDVMRLVGETGWVSECKWRERCEWLRSMSSTYFIVVITEQYRNGTDERVVASGTVFFENKFLHGLGVVGHIEDIAVAPDQKGKRMGLRILDALVFAAKERGCYKVSSAMDHPCAEPCTDFSCPLDYSQLPC